MCYALKLAPGLTHKYLYRSERFAKGSKSESMEQHALKNVNKCLNTNIYSHLETSGGKSSNQYLNVVHFFNVSVN